MSVTTDRKTTLAGGGFIYFDLFSQNYWGLKPPLSTAVPEKHHGSSRSKNIKFSKSRLRWLTKVSYFEAISSTQSLWRSLFTIIMRKDVLKHFCDLFEIKNTDFFNSCIFDFKISRFWLCSFPFIVAMEILISLKVITYQFFMSKTSNWYKFHIDTSLGSLLNGQMKS